MTSVTDGKSQIGKERTSPVLPGSHLDADLAQARLDHPEGQQVVGVAGYHVLLSCRKLAT